MEKSKHGSIYGQWANKLIQLWQIERDREIGIRPQVEVALRAKLKVQRTKEEDGPKQWAKFFFF